MLSLTCSNATVDQKLPLPIPRNRDGRVLSSPVTAYGNDICRSPSAAALRRIGNSEALT